MSATTEIPVQVNDATIAHLDFEPEVTCEADATLHFGPCARLAAWWFTCQACGHRIPHCDGHRIALCVAFAQLAAEPDAFVHCPRCEGVMPALRWTRLFAFLPIGGA